MAHRTPERRQARELQKRTGMSYQSALNQIRKQNGPTDPLLIVSGFSPEVTCRVTSVQDTDASDGTKLVYFEFDEQSRILARFRQRSHIEAETIFEREDQEIRLARNVSRAEMPPSGVIYVDDEAIGYSSVDHEFGSTRLLGLTRGMYGTHRSTHWTLPTEIHASEKNGRREIFVSTELAATVHFHPDISAGTPASLRLENGQIVSGCMSSGNIQTMWLSEPLMELGWVIFAPEGSARWHQIKTNRRIFNEDMERRAQRLSVPATFEDQCQLRVR